MGVAIQGKGVITAVSSAHIYSCVHVQVQAGAGTQWQASEALHHPLRVRDSLGPVQVNSTGMITKLADYNACTVSLECVGSFVEIRSLILDVFIRLQIMCKEEVWMGGEKHDVGTHCHTLQTVCS